MKLFFVSLVGFFLNQSHPPLHGTYSYGNVKSKSNYSLYGLLEIHQKANKDILFYLEVGRTSDYNSGAMYGKLNYDAKKGHYLYIPSGNYGCKLDMSISKSKIVVKIVSGDCGFGYGVLADGTYYLKSKANPVYIITRANKKVYFDKTSPEKFQED